MNQSNPGEMPAKGDGGVNSTTVQDQPERFVEARLAAIVNSSNDAIVSKSIEGIVTSWNRGAERLFGYSAAEMIGQSIKRLLPPNQMEEEDWILERILRGELVNHFDTVRIRKDGTRVDISLTISPIRRADGTIIGASKIARDIGERIAAQREINLLNAQLEMRVRERTAQLQAANRELEAFSYSVSHDLRAPVRAVHGFAHVLAEDYGHRLDAEGHRVLRVIQSEAYRMGELIDDLLALSRLDRQALRLTEVDMSAQCRSVCEQLEQQARSPDLRIHIEDLPAVSADVSMMRQVWTNLISNAIKYSSKRPNPTIHVTGRVGPEEISYRIQDNGAGFDMEQASQLFGVFQRLHSDAEFEGNGIGLALVQRIVQRHHGTISAEGKPNGGAVFTFSLPQTGSPLTSPPPSPPAI
ncbi:MAG: PAS domain S-box protein [Verrucomicrobiales bacterium]|nr:PAS domain S-box protein [Verrucomicrobiales bacterium]